MFRKIDLLFCFLIGGLFLLVVSCEQPSDEWKDKVDNTDLLMNSSRQLTDVLIHDIFSPPVASRVYAYPSIAAYECARFLDPDFKSFAGQLNGLEKLPEPDVDQEYAFQVAAVHAFNLVGKQLIFSEQMITDLMVVQDSLIDTYGIPKAILNRSREFGEEMAAAILEYADKDNYKETRSAPKYTVKKDPSRWIPTPPGYMDGIEPEWREIRTFVLDSAQQFKPPLATNFSTDKNSRFFKETMEVYDAVNNATFEHVEIAKFWDCNPYVMNITGHVMLATKKITPGGHWMEIVTIANKKANASFTKATEAYAMTAIALVDAFISCWDEKYRSNLIRPETVINEHIDEKWAPLLQTPPFPEYTSGHSVISRAAAVTLTNVYGDNFAFHDDSEVRFGLPARDFSSFLEASEEAAISRLYGGIHYMPAIDNGVKQGENIGNFIVANVKTK
ncbi:MAG: phosphatase PAP2 family protein [Bacteroidetes bacterium]|nr:MAG: phosphatase PAP2 family protein [Bacteroidota bacterium]